MLKFYFKLLFFSFCLYNCSKGKEEIPDKVKEAIASYENCNCSPTVDKYKWRKKKVYAFSFRAPNCNWVGGYIDEDGTELVMDPLYTYNDFINESKFIENVWECN